MKQPDSIKLLQSLIKGETLFEVTYKGESCEGYISDDLLRISGPSIYGFVLAELQPYIEACEQKAAV